MTHRILVILAAVLCALSLPTIWAASARGAATHETKLWLIKQNDLHVIGDKYRHDFRWVVCGISTGLKCKGRQPVVYTSYFAFRRAVRAGHLRRGATVIFDQETWHGTPPAEQKQPLRYLKLAGKLAHTNGIFIIMTPYQRGWAAEIAADAAAAPYAAVVGVQSQRLDASPVKFRRYLRRAIAAIRAASPTVPIMAGLAPDAGGTPVSAADMTREYRAAYPLVSGFWLNVPEWPNGTGCAPKGCPFVARAFLHTIGVTS